MVKLDAALAKLEAMLTGYQEDQKRGTPADRVKQIIGQRTDVMTVLADITQLSAIDRRLQTNPALGNEFSTRLRAFRHTVSTMQAKWRAVAMEADFDGFSRDAAAGGAMGLDFLRWAKTSLGPPA